MNNTEKNTDSAACPMVSVVMIAYNSGEYIGEAIKGVVSQKAPFGFELIVMDDCSTDSTPQIIEDWRRRFPGIIRSFRNPVNLGIQGNYIAGFAHCRGRYLAMCDADDYWFHRRKLARQVEYMEAHPECAITFHRMVNYYEADGEKSLSNGGQAPLTDIADLSRGNFITNASVMYRRECVDLLNLPPWVHNESLLDYAMHMLYARHGNIRFFGRPMGVYRKTSGSKWSMNSEYEKLRMALTVRLSLISELTDRPEAVEGLKGASANILAAMTRCASDDGQKDYVRRTTLDLGITLPTADSAGGSRRKPLLTRVRAAMSKLVPLPRP